MLALRVREGERLFLGRLGGLPDREDPDQRVGLDEEVTRHLLVLGADRVQAGRVDDLDATERLERMEDLDDAHGGRLRVGQLAQERAHGGGIELARRAVVVHDARAGGLSVPENIHRRRRRCHARGRDLLADERVDEGGLARVELAHDGDEQRAIERLERAARGRSERDERRCTRRERVGPAEQTHEARARRGHGRVGRDDEPARRLVGRDPRERHELVVARRAREERAERGGGEHRPRAVVGGGHPGCVAGRQARERLAIMGREREREAGRRARAARPRRPRAARRRAPRASAPRPRTPRGAPRAPAVSPGSRPRS